MRCQLVSGLAAALLIAITCVAAVVASDVQPPRVQIDIPAKFNKGVSIKQFKTGDETISSPFYSLKTRAAMTEYRGCWQRCKYQELINHNWWIRVYATNSPRVVTAYTAARDGYDADLCEERDYFGVTECSHLFARFQRKTFGWGNAVCFFSQITQDGMYSPHNGHLEYQIWGTTADKKYTLVASFLVTHRKLPDWGSEGVRDIKTDKEMRRNHDYRLITTCSRDEFQPPLDAIYQVVNSVRID